MLSLSLSQKDLVPNQLKHKNLPPQDHFATPTRDNQIKPVHSLVKQGTVFPSQKDDCHPILADFCNDIDSFRIEDTGKNIKFKPLDSFLFETFTPFQSQYTKPIKKNTETLKQQSEFLNDTEITEKKFLLKKSYHKLMIFLSLTDPQTIS